MSSVDEDYQIFLNDVYQSVANTATVAPSKLAEYTDELVASTYGELQYLSVIKLLKKLRLNQDDIFLDLGSGMGKCALVAYLRTQCQKVIGIEGVYAYHQVAVDMAQLVRNRLPGIFSKGHLDLICGNFLDFDLDQATAVYTCSTCFPQSLLWLIGEKLNRAKNVTQVMSLKPIANFTRLPLKAAFSVECSWDSSMCFWYAQ